MVIRHLLPSILNLKIPCSLSFLETIQTSTISQVYDNKLTPLILFHIQQASVDLGESYLVNPVNNTVPSQQTFSHLNVVSIMHHLNHIFNTQAGLSLWYQMINKPDFYKAFQALLKVRQQYVDEFFLRAISYQAY